ncbi:MAG: hypothetical protein H0V05_10680, partial [Euzebyaceae bacterium]|nr:hypothetical protein [Euzebyaceae bacterium]
RGVRVSHEAGGQVELSFPCQATVVGIERDVELALARLRDLDRAAGIGFLAAGLDPLHDAAAVGLQLTSPRYVSMNRHFDAFGPAGREMMRLTASLQICVDLLPGPAGLEQWRLAHLAGPALASVFANSPGAPPGRASAASPRLGVWLAVDGSRTGFDSRHVTRPSAAEGYVAFAAAAMVIPRGGRGDGFPPRQRSFAEWCGEGADRPDDGDLTHHLSTLFPPVRAPGRLPRDPPSGRARTPAARGRARRHLDVAAGPPLPSRDARAARRRDELGSWWTRTAVEGIRAPASRCALARCSSWPSRAWAGTAADPCRRTPARGRRRS